ncbi:hypothetical protein P153DRAFT_435347 [Dothidotthia symphoricarpi CBS 119687]|uniref:Uncharacterized protein n=1 Tax=Dothidotthia symphoricarpi CBS 119687 TaxID=1392245 RepID=A0A6A5ZX34_9PLEO|nr:uncharacterized protein P153DRAFT_435347 [Dothidotthia symphoricarpi CBS 119687]KAF2124140.1 hypothetical protein P153DRAFT_435347 [Dothidotthia symphoricarpi CBS 119687]
MGDQSQEEQEFYQKVVAAKFDFEMPEKIARARAKLEKLRQRRKELDEHPSLIWLRSKLDNSDLVPLVKRAIVSLIQSNQRSLDAVRAEKEHEVDAVRAAKQQEVDAVQAKLDELGEPTSPFPSLLDELTELRLDALRHASLKLRGQWKWWIALKYRHVEVRYEGKDGKGDVRGKCAGLFDQKEIFSSDNAKPKQMQEDNKGLHSENVSLKQEVERLSSDSAKPKQMQEKKSKGLQKWRLPEFHCGAVDGRLGQYLV